MSGEGLRQSQHASLAAGGMSLGVACAGAFKSCVME